MNKIAFLILLLCFFTNCSKDSNEAFEPTNYNYYYPTDEASITAAKLEMEQEH